MLKYSLDVATYDWLYSINVYFPIILAGRCDKENKFAKDISF
jgi:hypothetical protein